MPGPYGTGLLDDFNRANEDPIVTNWTVPTFSDETTGPANWDNQLDFGPGSAHYDLAEYGPDCEAWIKVVALSFAAVEIRARIQGEGGAVASGSYYAMRINASNEWNLRKLVAGSASDLTSLASFSMAPNDQIALACRGTSIEAWHKPAAGSWTMLGSVTDSAITAAGPLGMWSNDGSCNCDDFGGGNTEATPTFRGTQRRGMAAVS